MKENTTEKYFYGLGRRKNASARIYLKEGKGEVWVNKKKIQEYFPLQTLRKYTLSPLKLKEINKKVDLKVFVKGGGVSGQAGAIRLGIARALLEYQPDWKEDLRKNGMLTRDSRAVERKKYGQKGARAKFQYSKR